LNANADRIDITSGFRKLGADTPATRGGVVKIADILVKDAIVLDLRGRNKRVVLSETAKALAGTTSGLDRKRVVEVLNEREKLMSTGITDGIAIPHGKFPDLSHLVAVFARSREGVDFGSMDGQLTHLFFLLAVPEHAGAQFLEALARISLLLHGASFRARLWEAESREEICRAVEEEEAKC
jgi:mannitol/fructose-specific phosphotransferase system IIA component (Ntr-type)